MENTCGSRNSFLVPDGCGGWKRSGGKSHKVTYSDRTDILEQRYQQLEQVAKEMYKAFAPMHEYCCEENCCNLGEMGWNADFCSDGFREQLEALGVNVDD